ncbi:unnamed protein product [Hapterophycus canaliculatus]
MSAELSAVLTEPGAADAKVDVGDLPSITEDATCADWAAWIPRRSDPAVVMQQVVSEDYIPIQRNFIRLMERNSSFNRHNLYLICVDHASQSFFEKHMGVRCVPMSALHLPTHEEIWKLRVRVLSCLVAGGVDVIMSDADALWLNDPARELFYGKAWGGVGDSDVVASRGAFPFELGEAWGTTMCMGFILFRAKNAAEMAAFLRVVEDLVLKTEDDQVSLNQAAAQLGIVWDVGGDMRYEQSTGYGMGVIPAASIAATDGGGEGLPVTVTLLPHSTYTRRCEQTPVSSARTVVAHCFFPEKLASVKTSWMEKLNLWSVNADP